MSELNWVFRAVLVFFMLLTPFNNLYFYALAVHPIDRSASTIADVTASWNVLHHYTYMSLPLSLFACALAAVAKPLGGGRHTAVVVTAGLVASYGSAVTELVGNYRAGNDFFLALGYPWVMMVFVFPPIWWCLVRMSGKVAALPSVELSDFLVNAIGMQGIRESIPLLVMAARSASCLQTAGDNPVLCDRLVLANMFPSGYLAFFAVARLASVVVPEEVKERHVLSLRKVATLDITKTQFAECMGYTVTLLCVIFFVLNAKKDFSPPDHIEVTAMWVTGIVGGASILFVVTWKGCRVMMDIRRLSRDGVLPPQASALSPNFTEVKWDALAVLLILPVPSTCAMFAATSNYLYIDVLRTYLPFAIVVYSYSIFFRPRRKGTGDGDTGERRS